MHRATAKASLRDRLDQRLFNALWSRNLVYNTCWEDPAVDRKALDLDGDSTVLVITSAGCNALDYALQQPRRVHCVDANPRQNALLELKVAAIRALEFEDFFRLFGEGAHPEFEALYRWRLQAQLSPFARAWWDKRLNWFSGRRGSFYFHGMSGWVARGVRAWLRSRPKLREAMMDLLAATSLEAQRGIYDERVAPLLWRRTVNWAISRAFVMTLLGVPHPQRRMVAAQHEQGIAGFIRESVQYVFRELPIADNYFWRVYLTGRYDPACCPAYLKPEGFRMLKAGAVDCLAWHTDSVTGFLQGSEERFSHYVLLDHMDWMGAYYPEALAEEWDALLTRASPGARILLRSAQARPDWLDTLRVGADAKPLRQSLKFHDALAAALHPADRVHTYAGFVIADVLA